MLLDLRNSRLVASSGIRRLQLWKMQEESLIKDAAQKAAKNVVEAETPAKIEVEQPVRKIKPVVRKRRRETVETFKPPVLAPVKTLPSVYELLLQLPPIIIEQVFWKFQQTVVVSIEKSRQRRQRRKAAALLLMAA